MSFTMWNNFTSICICFIYKKSLIACACGCDSAWGKVKNYDFNMNVNQNESCLLAIFYICKHELKNSRKKRIAMP